MEFALPVATYRHVEAPVRVSVFEGRVTPDDLQRIGRMFHNVSAFRAADPAFCVFRPGTDVSGVEPGDLLDLESTVGESFAGRAIETVRVAMVAKSASVNAELRLWRQFTRPARSYRYEYALFDTFSEAVAWHRLAPEWAALIRDLEGFREVA